MEIEKILKKLASMTEKPAKVGKCLTEEEMCSIVDNTVNDKDRNRFIEHILSCRKCCQEYKEIFDLVSELEKENLL